jgi:hypothetical protein
MLVGNHLNFDTNEAQNIVIHNVASLPAAPKNGMICYLSATGQHGLYLRKEGNWVNLGTVEALSNGGINITPISGIQYLSVNVDGNTIIINPSGALEVKENGIGVREINTAVVRVTDFAAPDKNFAMANFKITGLGTPTANSDATTKEYVDLEIASKIAAMGEFIGDWSTASFPTTGSGPSGAIQKGDWWRISAVVTIGTIVCEIGDALFARINNPGTNEANWFVLQANVGEATSTALGLVRVSAAADLTATAGSNTTRVVRIADLLARTATETRTGLIALATQAELTTGTNDTKAVTPLKLVTYVNTLVSSRGFVANIGTGSATSITVTHNLNSKNVIAQVSKNSGDEDIILVPVRKPTVNSVAIDFATAPGSNAYKVKIVKVD